MGHRELSAAKPQPGKDMGLRGKVKGKRIRNLKSRSGKHWVPTRLFRE